MSRVSRRDTLKWIAAGAAAGATTACHDKSDPADPRALEPTATTAASSKTAAGSSPILRVDELSFPWPTLDPFLACMHHEDGYPAGNAQFGPVAALEGRNLGSDFGGKDGWSMYHGRVVPGFPQHPHRGFETVSVVRRGLLDHADSMGAAARYGGGDVQWLTAGRGIQHAEMFPLLDRKRDNPLEMFQIWLNLPRSNKMVAPHFKLLWRNDIPKRTVRDQAGRATKITVIAGAVDDARAPAPPPSSWAAQADSHVAIWTVAFEPSATWTLPAGPPGVNRALYFHVGRSMQIAGRNIDENRRIVVDPTKALAIHNGDMASEILLLQGRPIGEPVARRGPFVMNTDAEIQQAFADYRATRFGGWPWDVTDPVHGSEDARFARHPDGSTERPT